MMFTPGGQIDRLTFAGVRGGKGGGGGGGDNGSWMRETTVVDPVTGEAFTSSPWSMYQGGKSAADQLNEHIRARKGEEKTASEAAATTKAAETAANRETFGTSKQNAYNDALQNTIRQFQLQGLDPNQYMESDIKPRLQAQMNSIKDLDPNPSAAFSPDLGSTIINDLTGGVRTKALNDLNSIFTPTYSTSNLSSSITTPYVDQIVSEQFDPLSTQLENARKRNVLNETGYGAALNALGQKRTGARATVQNLGESILASNRSELDDYINSARSAANSSTINSGFDPNAYTGRARSMVDTDIGNFGGALRNATQGTQFANLSDLMNAGGAVQGGANTTPLTASGAIPDNTAMPGVDALAQRKRGLGNQGAF